MERQRLEDDMNLSRIPVFVFPSTVYFNAYDRDQLKQILTIYNPYEFPVRFKVLCTSPDLYTVIDPEGSIKSKNCVDLILRISPDISFDNHLSLEHKFRVQIYHFNDRKLIGRRDVPSVIHKGNIPSHLAQNPESSSSAGGNSSSDAFQQCPPGHGSRGANDHPISSTSSGGGNGNNQNIRGFLPPGQQPNYVIIITAIVCIIGLMLPISSDSCIRDSNLTSTTTTSHSLSSIIPNYLHLTVNQKLLAAYALGLVTMVIFRP